MALVFENNSMYILCRDDASLGQRLVHLLTFVKGPTTRNGIMFLPDVSSVKQVRIIIFVKNAKDLLDDDEYLLLL